MNLCRETTIRTPNTLGYIHGISQKTLTLGSQHKWFSGWPLIAELIGWLKDMISKGHSVGVNRWRQKGFDSYEYGSSLGDKDSMKGELII